MLRAFTPNFEMLNIGEKEFKNNGGKLGKESSKQKYCEIHAKIFLLLEV